MTFLSLPDANDPRPIYEQIMSEIRKAIVRGALHADDPLPSTRQLALDLRVNPNTVQQAYRELEREGVVYVLRGRGSFVNGAKRSKALHATVVREIALTAIRAAAKEGIGAEALANAIMAMDESERVEALR